MLATANNFVTEFSTNRRTVIRSKWLRIPELFICACLLAVVLGYHMVMKLDFLMSVPVESYFRITSLNPWKDWWGCATELGTCRAALPDKHKQRFCTEPMMVSTWDSESRKKVLTPRNVSCQYIDLQTNVLQSPVSIMLATATSTKREYLEGGEGGIWEGIPQQHNFNFIVGGEEQMIRLEGTVRDTSLDNLQGFLKFSHMPVPQRIRCAAEGEWLDSCNTSFSAHWQSRYPEGDPVGKPTMSSDMEECASLAGSGIQCPLRVLLKAAGVDLDEEVDDTGSLRKKGVSLQLHVQLTNADPHDYWNWQRPWLTGPKQKYIITARVNKVGVVPMFTTFSDDEGNIVGQYLSRNMTHRKRVDQYGIHLSLVMSTTLKEFRHTYFLTVLLILFAIFNNAEFIVSRGLVKLYRYFGDTTKHVSLLFDYNAVQHSMFDEDVKQCKDVHELANLHRQAQDKRLMSEHFGRGVSWSSVGSVDNPYSTPRGAGLLDSR